MILLSQSNIFENLYIKGCVYAFFSELGPEPMFFYPVPKDMRETFETTPITSDLINERDFIQVAVKSISLLMSDYTFSSSDDEHLKDFQIFGVLPYPDISMIGFTFFSYSYNKKREIWMPLTFTLLVEENHRNFIFNSIERIKSLMIPMHEFFREKILVHNLSTFQDCFGYWDEFFPKMQGFFENIQKVQSLPISPITTHQRIKILFTGLENTGKTSFLLTIRRKYSSIPSLLPTIETVENKLDFLGSTIIKWDIPGNKDLREKVLEESEIYLYDTDVIYFFINVREPRIKESKAYLSKIIQVLNSIESQIPIIFVVTKVDSDIAENKSIKDILKKIQDEFIPIVQDFPFCFFNTSIFSLYSILNAFSYGLRQLSPNRDMIQFVLQDFLSKLHLRTGLILNENGLVLSSAEVIPMDTSGKDSLKTSQIFEVAAPQFTSIASKYEQYQKPMISQMNKYEFSPNDLVLLKPFSINQFNMFGLFYSQESNMDEVGNKIESNFESLHEKLKRLLHHYIS